MPCGTVRSPAPVRSRSTLVLVAVAVALAGGARPGAARGAVKYITCNAHITNNTSVNLSHANTSLFSAGAPPIAGTVFNSTVGSADYNAHAAVGVATISGTSTAVTFGQWVLTGKHTQADAYLQISDSFAIEGDLPANASANVKVVWSGALFPNTAFESEYAAAFGRPTRTTAATFNLYYGWVDNQGNIVGGRTIEDGRDSSQGSGTFTRTTDFNMSLDEDTRRIGFILTIGGVGTHGGAFNFAGTGDAGSIGTESTAAGDGAVESLAAAADEGFLDDSFFEMVVELPPGLSVAESSGYFVRSVTVPEPSAAAAALPSLLAGALAARRPRRGPRS